MDCTGGSSVMINHIAQKVELALDLFKEGKYDKCRDAVIKSGAALELMSPLHSNVNLLGEIDGSHREQLQTIASVLRQLSDDLKVFQNSRSKHGREKCEEQVHRSSSSSSPTKKLQELEHSPIKPAGSNNTYKSFADIIGNMAAKTALYENVVLPLTVDHEMRMQIFKGIRGGCGNVLLFGDPGTGKTALCQAAAVEANAMLFVVRPSDVLSKYQGESERSLRTLFEKARKFGRSIIFFDEIDSIAMARGGFDEGNQSRRLLSELLMLISEQKQMQAYSRSPPAQRQQGGGGGGGEHCEKAEGQFSGGGCDGEVVIIAATNRLTDLDEALVRRFESKVFVALPTLEDRRDMILHFCEGIDICLSEDDLQQIAAQTDAWSGSEIENLCRDAAMEPIREWIRESSSSSSSSSTTLAYTSTSAVTSNTAGGVYSRVSPSASPLESSTNDTGTTIASKTSSALTGLRTRHTYTYLPPPVAVAVTPLPVLTAHQCSSEPDQEQEEEDDGDGVEEASVGANKCNIRPVILEDFEISVRKLMDAVPYVIEAPTSAQEEDL